MHRSPYVGYYDVDIPEHWKVLLGKCSAFEGVQGPKKRPIINYGLPEYQTMLVAIWHFTRLPLYTQLCLIDDHDRSGRKES